jgi:zinc protease
MNELRKMAAAPPTEQELNTSKRGYIDRFPGNFSTKGRTANILAADEFTGRYARDPQYWAEYRERIAAVTGADVQRVAKKYLAPEKAVILIVGQKSEVLMKLPDHPVELKDLTSGKIVDVPLRDPMTMKPMAEASKPDPKKD